MTTSENPVQVDVDQLFNRVMAYLDAGENNEDTHGRAASILEFVEAYGKESYNAGKDKVLREGPVRIALLDAQAKWLDEADKADGSTGRTVANVIAGVFGELADEYRTTPKPQIPKQREPEHDNPLDGTYNMIVTAINAGLEV